MNKYRSLSIGVICMLLLSILVACKPVIPGRVLLSTPRTTRAFTPVAAVEANGTRHFAWTEPDSVYTRRAIVYARLYPDGKFYLVEWHSASSGVHYGNPDLVVADNGTAFLSYTGCPSGSPPSDCTAYFSGFDKNWHGTPPLVYSAGTGPVNLVLVQRAGWVYVMGADLDPGDPYTSSITYKQLTGGIRQGLVAEQVGYWAATPSGVIDAAGDLHVAFRSFSSGGSDRIGYANNVGSAGDMAAVYHTASTGFTTPAISQADASGDIFVAYATHEVPSNSLNIWRPYPLPATPPAALVLTSGTNWQILDSPALVAFGDGNYAVIFSALNSGTTGEEIWVYSKSASSLTRITNDVVRDSAPLAVKAASGFPVYAWRTWSPGEPGHTCYGDVKVVTNAMVPSVYTAFEDKGTCDNDGFDLAVSGGEGVGVWLDLRDGSSLLEPWYATDWLENYLPAVRK